MGGYACGTRKYCIRSEVVVCEGGAGPDFGVRSVWKVGWVFVPARIVFGRLAKGVVAAGYRLLEPFAVGLVDCHVVVVGTVVPVVSASQVVLGRLFRDIVGTGGWRGCSGGRPFHWCWRM